MLPFTMTRKFFRIYETRYGIIPTCKICECPILIGQKVYSFAQRYGKLKTKLYHEKCYEDSLIDSDDEDLDFPLYFCFEEKVRVKQK